MTDFLDQIRDLSPKRLALLAVQLKDRLDAVNAAAREPIAVIGIGCRFPGADGPDAFWTLLHEGRDGIREVPTDRWAIDEYFDPNPDAPGKMSTRGGGFLERIDGFDPSFFGIAPREAMLMDPQQRLLLEVSWEALEHAGLSPTRLAGSRTGVFVGICNTDYHQLLLKRGAELIDAYLASGSAHSVASGRLSYLMGFQGPSLAIDTSCSASLVAIHAACQSLRAGESTLALAGGVNVICAPETSIALSKGHMLAPDGRCKTFDAAADGFSRAEGCGIVVLKLLSAAQRDGDRILALVRGSAVNQDGRSGGLTVPNGPAQEAVIRDALAAAGVHAAEIGYVEAHGTGTSLGDPIEVRALGRVLGEGRDPSDPLVIGSVKTNFGHLESAAGVGGFIKVVLALQNEEIPRHLHFKVPNPHVDWESLPVIVASERRPWPTGTRPRRAGVSSFGFSGTNAHAILEEAPAINGPTDAADRPLHCLTLSAPADRPLRLLAQRYADSLGSGKAIQLADAAHTAAVGRAHFNERLAVVAANNSEARTALAAFASSGSHPDIRRGTAVPSGESDVVFLYTGAGSQYPGMGQALYETSPVFRDAIDRCGALLGADAYGLTLQSVLQADAADNAPIHDIGWTQPALFAVEYALTELWRSWGVEPAAVIGHSVGEYAAACAAGVFTLEDGLNLIAERGRLLQALPRDGMMAALFAPADEVTAAVARLADRVSVAAVNASDSVVISGETAAVESLLSSFAERNVVGHRLFVSLAAHSPLVEPALDAMELRAGATPMSAPRIPVAWNLTGRISPAGVAPDALYWRRHMREPVRFADGINALYGQGYRIFLEVGPHPTLMALAQRSLPERETLCLTSLRRGKDDWREMLTSLADLHIHGVGVDWSGVDRPYTRRRVTLPMYPFERNRYWAAPTPHVDQGERASANPQPTSSANTDQPSNGLFYKVEWEPISAIRPRLEAPSKVLEGSTDRFKELAIANDLSIYDDLMPELDGLSAMYVRDALAELKFDASVGRRFSAAAEAARLGIAEHHRRLFARLLAMLAQDGVLQSQSGGYIIKRPFPVGNAAAKNEELLSKFSGADAELTLLRRCGKELASVLRGEQDPLPLLFPGGSFNEARKLYADSPLARTYNGMLGDLLLHARRPLGVGQSLRVLEIGAGTGGTTSSVLPLLGHQVDYTFTDLSSLFLARASEQFREYPLLRTKLLDIERDPEEQGVEPGSYDVVIAANVLHATADMRRTMTHVSRLLAPGGLLFVAEGVLPERWVDLTFGLTEGWWRVSDVARRPDGPLLDRDGWRRLLKEVGFVDVKILPEEMRETSHAMQQACIVAAWPGTQSSRQWIVLADEGQIAGHLEEELRATGDTVTIVGPETWRPAMASADILSQAAWWPGAEKSGANPNIISLAGLDSGGGAAVAPDFARMALVFLQAAARADRARVWLVTRGAQDVRGLGDVIAPDQAAVWGLGRTFALEHPTQWGGLLDLDPLGDTGDSVAAILHATRASHGEDQAAWRDDEYLVPRLVPTAPPASAAIAVKPDRSYLITGGLGGLGLRVAHWLAEKGARHIVLAGRTALPHRQDWARLVGDARVSSVINLERVGVNVETVALDVGDTEAMAVLMEKFGREWPPLGGIVHAAVAPTAAPFAEMPLDLFEAMYRTKVRAAYILDALSVSQPVEFFVVFSTTTALLGSVQLAHYAAANAALDSFACWRRSKGRPALSVNWGSWDQLQSVSEEDRIRIARGGLRPMATAVGLAALESLLAAGATRAIVADVDWSALRAAYESRRRQPLLSRIGSIAPERSAVEVNGESEDLSGLSKRLEQETPEARRELLLDFIRAEVAAVLGVSGQDTLPLDRGLFEMGMDSLMSVELRSRLERGMGRGLPSTLTFNYPNIGALAAFLEREVGATGESMGAIVSTPSVSHSSIDDLDQLTDSELEARLVARMEEAR